MCVLSLHLVSKSCQGVKEKGERGYDVELGVHVPSSSKKEVIRLACLGHCMVSLNVAPLSVAPPGTKGGVAAARTL
jgi:hypothetical protein